MPPRDVQGSSAPKRQPRRQPRGNSITALTKAVAKAVPPAASQRVPRTDAQSPAGDYGRKQVQHFEHGPVFKHAIRQVFDAQPPAQQRELVKTATAHPDHPTSRAILEHVAALPGTPFGRFQANEPLAPILRARTQASADVARGFGYHGPEGVLARIGTQINPTPKDEPKKSAGLGLLATSFGPLGIAKAISHGDLAGVVAAGDPAAPILKALPLTGHILRNAAQDAVDIPAEVVPSTYDVAKTAIHDPGKAAKELAAPYVHLAQHPVSDFVKHPLQSYLLFEGIRGGIGRGAGRAMRAAPEGSLPQRLASTERASATLPGTSLEQARRYSPDVTRKAIQSAGDVRKAAKAERLRAKARGVAAAGDPEAAQALAEEANRVDPKRINPSEVRRRMDERQDANEQLRRMHRADVTSQADEIIGKQKGAALSLATQRIAQPTVEDLRAYRDEIAAEYPALKRATLQQANVNLRKQIDQAIARPDRLAGVQEAADAYQQLVGPMSAKLGEIGVYAPEQVDMAPLVPYAARNMGARFVRGHFESADGERLTDAEVRQIRENHGDLLARSLIQRVPDHFVDPEGRVLTADDIRAHMAAHGVGEPAYVTQAPHSRSGYLVPQHEAPSVPRGTRTGIATTRGTFDASPETLREGAARMQGLIDAHDGYAATIHEFGLRDSPGQVRTFGDRQDAVKVADELAAKGEGRWRPVRVQPFAGRSAQLHDLLEQTSSGAQPDHQTIRDAISAAIGTDASGAGPLSLVPEAAADQLAQHIRVMGSAGAGKAVQLANSMFRKTVLATNPRWIFGNTGEAGLRSAVDRAGPRSWFTGHAVQRVNAEEPANRGTLSRVGDVVFGPYQGRNPQAAEELAARAFGGGHYSLAERAPRRGYEQFQGTRLEPVANALHTFWSTPGPKQAAGLWHKYTDVVFHDLNAPIERQFQTALAGAHIRRTLMDDHLVKVSKQAIEDAARGLEGTTAQVDLARAIDRSYGRYSKLSPTERRLVFLYAPFLNWARNALQFVAQVLPRDHPVLTSAIVAAHQASTGWRQQHGLDLFEAGAAPAFLQGSIPVGGGGKVRASRFTPFSLFDDLPGTSAGEVLPQLSGTLSGLEGQQWTGRPLPGVSNRPADPFPKAGAAALALVEATIPLTGQLDTYLSAAGSPTQRLRKLVDPFAASRPKPKQSRSGGRKTTRTGVGLPTGSYSTGGAGTLPSGSYSIGP